MSLRKSPVKRILRKLPGASADREYQLTLRSRQWPVGVASAAPCSAATGTSAIGPEAAVDSVMFDFSEVTTAFALTADLSLR